jgi:hypothetical protein
MCALAGLQAAALTDHNSCRNCPPFVRHAQSRGLIALPGMELCTKEEVHVICLFPNVREAEDFSDFVYGLLPDIKNRPDRFGNQYVCDEEDNYVSQAEKFLLSAADIGIYEVAGLVCARGGVAFPSHIDRDAFSLLSNLGLWDGAMGFSFAERTRGSDPLKLPRIPYIFNSDAHALEDLPDARHSLEIAEKTPEAIIDALKNLCYHSGGFE